MYIILSLVCGIIIFVLFCNGRPRRGDRRRDVRHEIRAGGKSFSVVHQSDQWHTYLRTFTWPHNNMIICTYVYIVVTGERQRSTERVRERAHSACKSAWRLQGGGDSDTTSIHTGTADEFRSQVLSHSPNAWVFRTLYRVRNYIGYNIIIIKNYTPVAIDLPRVPRPLHTATVSLKTRYLISIAVHWRSFYVLSPIIIIIIIIIFNNTHRYVRRAWCSENNNYSYRYLYCL